MRVRKYIKGGVGEERVRKVKHTTIGTGSRERGPLGPITYRNLRKLFVTDPTARSRLSQDFPTRDSTKESSPVLRVSVKKLLSKNNWGNRSDVVLVTDGRGHDGDSTLCERDVDNTNTQEGDKKLENYIR